MDRLKTLNDLKALVAKQNHIEEILTSVNNPFEGNPIITVKGINIKVGINSMNLLLESEMKKAKIEYDVLLKSLIDDEGGF